MSRERFDDTFVADVMVLFLDDRMERGREVLKS